MKVWLIGLGLSLLCSVFAVDGSGASVPKMTGKWNAVGILTNCEDMMDYVDHMQIMVADVEFVSDGSLEIGFNIPLPGGCQKITMNFKKEESGQYSHESDWGHYSVVDSETDYKNWLAVNTKRENKSGTCNMIMFYTRDLKITKEEKNSFKKFCLRHGYKEDDIYYMPPEVACAESQ